MTLVKRKESQTLGCSASTSSSVQGSVEGTQGVRDHSERNERESATKDGHQMQTSQPKRWSGIVGHMNMTTGGGGGVLDGRAKRLAIAF